MSDARFEDGDEVPLRLTALDGEDLDVLSALVQDAVFAITEMTYAAKRRRFAVMLNRFRWEDAGKNAPERVQSLLVIEEVLGVKTQGIDRGDRDTILSLLAVNFTPDQDGAGRIDLILAGDGLIGLQVEALGVSLRDVTRPYGAVSGLRPQHDLGE